MRSSKLCGRSVCFLGLREASGALSSVSNALKAATDALSVSNSALNDSNDALRSRDLDVERLERRMQELIKRMLTGGASSSSQRVQAHDDQLVREKDGDSQAQPQRDGSLMLFFFIVLFGF